MNPGDGGNQRIVIVSNRLPFTVLQENSGLKFDPSVGGVATGLRAFLSSTQNPPTSKQEYLWVGWPGATISDELKEAVKSQGLAEFHCVPVFLSEQDIEHFYQGFCNKTIWPIFHYFPSYASYDHGYWLQYKKVNQAFNEALLEVIRPDDTLWIHDYHLMLLPNLVREQLPNVRIGFFLHIPFPHYEMFRLLPGEWRQEILKGLMGANLIGFHTHDYMEYFLRSVQRILGYEHNMGQLVADNRMVKVGAFPMGVDFWKFSVAARSPRVQKEKEGLHKAIGDTKVIVSVDRQDYSKGIIHRLQGFETMLEMNPEWHGRVTLMMLVVPSRIGIGDYERTKKEIEELVGKINGKFGSVSWTPVIYQYRAVPFDTLVAMYSMSHVALVTPLRDGMNLVAKEYVASRVDKTGVLILSEMAGSAKELAEAIIINPNNREEVAGALELALEMPNEEQIRRNKIMQDRLRRYDVTRWATDFMNELFSVPHPQDNFSAKRLSSAAEKQLIQDYCRSTRRLLFFDYDGTLTSFAKRPYLAKPNEGLLKLLDDLVKDSKNEVVLISGRDRATLQDWFGWVPLRLVAEHGAWIKEPSEDWRMVRPLSSDWKPKLLPTLEMYADRVPGAFVEKKEFSLVWHYRDADPEQGSLAARELTDALLTLTSNIDVQVGQGNRVVEVKNAGLNKGTATQLWLSKNNFDFILAIGDDCTDEDMFTVLPEGAYSIRVGMTETHARFNLSGPIEVLQLLEQLVETGRS
jgi:trehalose 6-phosphate synthase/phosphatase